LYVCKAFDFPAGFGGHDNAIFDQLN